MQSLLFFIFVHMLQAEPTRIMAIIIGSQYETFFLFLLCLDSPYFPCMHLFKCFVSTFSGPYVSHVSSFHHQYLHVASFDISPPLCTSSAMTAYQFLIIIIFFFLLEPRLHICLIFLCMRMQEVPLICMASTKSMTW